MSRAAVPVAFLCLALIGSSASAQEPDHRADRGPGIPTSLFGTYIRKGELLVYPFYEYTTNSGAEYSPSELGYQGKLEYMGKLVEHEYLLFLAYGIADGLAVELEGALYTEATLEKAPDDPSGLPDRLRESGLGDVEAQLRWRWWQETARRPEFFSFFEVVFPLQRDEVLIGTSDWELAQGFGFIKGLRWGTLTLRLAFKYEEIDRNVEPGEYALEYLRRVSPRWRLVAAIEGEDDEISIIGEAQWSLGRRAFLKLNSGFGLTEKAPDFAPEIGVIFSF